MENDKLSELLEKVYFKLLNFLSYRQRSEKEICDRLEKYLSKYKKLSKLDKDKILAQLMERITNEGYVNDDRFAQTYVSSFSYSTKPVSKRKITQFLLTKGVKKDVIEQALDQLPEDFSLQNALKDGEKKLRLLGPVDEYSKRVKLSSYLFRKGYDSSTISRVIDTLL